MFLTELLLNHAVQPEIVFVFLDFPTFHDDFPGDENNIRCLLISFLINRMSNPHLLFMHIITRVEHVCQEFEKQPTHRRQYYGSKQK